MGIHIQKELLNQLYYGGNNYLNDAIHVDISTMTRLEVDKYYVSDLHNGFTLRFYYNSELYDLNIGMKNCTYKMRLIYFSDSGAKGDIFWSIS